MPIYHKTPPTTKGNHNTAEIDYHNSEAAKVKRTREQAYFNSYDFDAIEVLPYDDDEEEEGDIKGKTFSQKDSKGGQGKSANGGVGLSVFNSQTKETLKSKQPQPQQKYVHQNQHQEQFKPQNTSNFSYKAAKSSSNSFITDSHHLQKQNQQQQQQPHHQQHHHPLHHVNSKYNPAMYLQRITGIFTNKTNKQLHPSHLQHQNQQHHNVVSVGGGGGGSGSVNNDTIALALNTRGHDNKHLKLSSSETSSTTSSSSSAIIIEEIVNVNALGSENGDRGTSINESVGGDGGVVDASGLGNRSAPLECIRDVIATNNSRTTANVDSVTTAADATTAGGNNGGNFLLPRAMLKYQSSTQTTSAGAIGSLATNSMPLATNASSSQQSLQQQQQQQHQQQQHLINVANRKDVHKLDGIKGGNIGTMLPTTSVANGLRLKKTSTSSSAITSLSSEDIEEEGDLEKIGNKDEIVVAKNINPKVTKRAASHQSHYSTDKSASSGYYSSNVCSTYSLEEHIYSEPTLDLKKPRNHDNESKATISKAAVANVASASSATTLQTTGNKLQQQLQTLDNDTNNNSVMRSLDFNRRYRYADNELTGAIKTTTLSNRNSQEFSENLKILESSIESLDRHLKSFPSNCSQETFNPYASVQHSEKLRSSSSYHHLPTIQESLDAAKKSSWTDERSDDSLMDIDLDSFLLDKDKKVNPKAKLGKNKGLDNPTFLNDEQEENHYKCAKYINSCPEDAYRVESDILAPTRSSISGQSLAVSVDLYPKRYEEQLHFQNTRELLEDVREKIRLLTQNQEAEHQKQKHSNAAKENNEESEHIPKELHSMINTLKQELELYLERMNQHSELEIRQLCTGLVKNQNIVKMKNAFERRKSLSEIPDMYSTYEAIQDGIVMNAQGVPISITQQITSIRCSSDPNFKMKRKSITEVFPMAKCYVESVRSPTQPITSTPLNENSQLQRNLNYHKPVLEQLQSSTQQLKSNNKLSGSFSESNDKDSILDWHRKKPSIWEMYYGTNRIQQSLLGGKKNGTMVTTTIASSPSTMCYPSSRPESDFTLDLPRAEQLRIKMEKEKKFRQRCRVITTFLSLVFFLLTVMVVSLVLTRGKRMFGSMI